MIHFITHDSISPIIVKLINYPAASGWGIKNLIKPALSVNGEWGTRYEVFIQAIGY
jgi:hypothetical protein